MYHEHLSLFSTHPFCFLHRFSLLSLLLQTANMAVVPVCYKMSYMEQTLPMQNLIRRSDKGSVYNYSTASPDKKRAGFMCGVQDHVRGSLFYMTLDRAPSLKREYDKECHSRTLYSKNAMQRENLSSVWYALESSSTEKQLGSLDSYFKKLQDEGNQHSSNSSIKMADVVDRSGQFKSKKGLESVEAYLEKVNKATFLVETPLRGSENSEQVDKEKVRSYLAFRSKEGESDPGNSQVTQFSEETSDLYTISILVSVNIAVYLFEIASPIKTSDSQLFSIPLLYGAKINDLILVGEWWRLLTPMFLHSGFLHVALSSWALLTFSPQVCRSYGSFTFLLIYLLGGISGNLTSFLHTPEPTVGGTGPIFAIIGAWLTYQIQNKDVTGKDVSESMFQKAITTTALSFVLSTFGPIDDWAHLGAAFVGVAYGFFTCPTLQLDNASSSRTGQEDGITLVKRSANPWKSLLVFMLFVLVLGSLLLFTEPPVASLESNYYI